MYDLLVYITTKYSILFYFDYNHGVIFKFISIECQDYVYVHEY